MNLSSNTETVNMSAERLHALLSAFCDTESQAFQEVKKMADITPIENGFSFTVANMINGTVSLKESVPYSSVTYAINTDKKISGEATFLIQSLGDNSSNLQITTEAEVPFMLKAMLEKPMQQGMNQIVSRIKEMVEQQA
ncbi:MAG: hypothetical protein K6A41_07875 [Bacteroidales bacterium]|nr:hypothetical protein [Bacteroidales bacterium]